MQTTHIIWDWNGTLLDDVEACVASINGMLEPRGLPPLSVEHYREIFDFPVKSYYASLGFDMASEDWDAMAREFHCHYARCSASSPLRPQARAVLDALDAAGVGCSILSASEAGVLHRMLEERGIRERFEHIHGLDNLNAESKLDQGRGLMAALASTGNRVVLVGDTLHDHDVATALGCDCILLAGGHVSCKRLRTAGRRVITKLPELLSALE